ncbi:hypothetical protein [Mesobacillus boroniphilus]|uniref:Uncharacterized protein n=1 Tax=Mesobacillus boroniphilus JCM 21738 TaxID=1294265 RepID=W4RTZ7_9BACI|nr:hypothetical protein [Mesobacillus boroniphilus]GAE47119.1 hypothetical protein JCM21738_4068 [Mesobacillus boroniphilus JCM 21738]
MELKLSNTEKELLGLSIMDIVVNSERYNSAEKKCLEEIYHRMNREPHEAKAGGILKDPPQIKYYSERGFPLTTQFVYDWNDESNGMLTVENYNKWYRVYRITREGEVKPVGREELVESRLA